MGKNQAGVLATPFRLTGPIAHPGVRVDAASTLLPGFTRDLLARPEQDREEE
jgi:hypothetical protein